MCHADTNIKGINDTGFEYIKKDIAIRIIEETIPPILDTNNNELARISINCCNSLRFFNCPLSTIPIYIFAISDYIQNKH